MNSGRSILLIEDDKVDSITIRRAMKELNILNPIEHVVNGLEGLEFLDKNKNNKPCIILLDLNMPKMNGLEFLNEMKKDPEYRKIPVVVLTTSNAELDIHKSYSIGVAGYMVKPVDYRQFIEVIKGINLYWTISEIPS